MVTLSMRERDFIYPFSLRENVSRGAKRLYQAGKFSASDSR
jgi:hypothetical protein